MQPLERMCPHKRHDRSRTGPGRSDRPAARTPRFRFGAPLSPLSPLSLLVAITLLCLPLLVPIPGFCTEPDMDFSLPIPASAADLSYLGIPRDDAGAKTFRLDQIPADLVLVEIFSMYCPICQREARDVNQVYEMIRGDDFLKLRIRMIGIGAGNSAFEVDFFKETYKIPFPLFSDGNFSIHKKIGQKGTPYFIGLKKETDGSLDIVFTWSGEIPDTRQFLDKLVQTAGITP